MMDRAQRAHCTSTMELPVRKRILHEHSPRRSVRGSVRTLASPRGKADTTQGWRQVRCAFQRHRSRGRKQGQPLPLWQDSIPDRKRLQARQPQYRPWRKHRYMNPALPEASHGTQRTHVADTHPDDKRLSSLSRQAFPLQTHSGRRRSISVLPRRDSRNPQRRRDNPQPREATAMHTPGDSLHSSEIYGKLQCPPSAGTLRAA